MGWETHQIGLELGDINVQGPVEAKGCRQGRHNLGHKTIQVGVSGALDVQIAATNVIKGFVVEAKGAVGVFQQRVR